MTAIMDPNFHQDNEREVEEFLEKLSNNLDSRPSVLVFTNPLFQNNGDIKQDVEEIVSNDYFTDPSIRSTDIIETIIEEEEDEEGETEEDEGETEEEEGDSEGEEEENDSDDDEEEEESSLEEGEAMEEEKVYYNEKSPELGHTSASILPSPDSDYVSGVDSILSDACNFIQSMIEPLQKQGSQDKHKNVSFSTHEENVSPACTEGEQKDSTINDHMKEDLISVSCLNDSCEIGNNQLFSVGNASNETEFIQFCPAVKDTASDQNSVTFNRAPPVDNLSSIKEGGKNDAFVGENKNILPSRDNREEDAQSKQTNKSNDGCNILGNIIVKQATIEVVEEELVEDFFTVEDMVGRFNSPLNETQSPQGKDICNDIKTNEIKQNVSCESQLGKDQQVDSTAKDNTYLENNLIDETQISNEQFWNKYFEKYIPKNIESNIDNERIKAATESNSKEEAPIGEKFMYRNSILLDDINKEGPAIERTVRRNSVSLDDIILEENKVENIIRRNSSRRNSISGEDVENALEVLKNSVETASAALSEKRNSVSMGIEEKPILDRGELGLNGKGFQAGEHTAPEGKHYRDEEEDIGDESEYFSAVADNFMDDDRDSFVEASENFLEHQDKFLSDHKLFNDKINEAERGYSLSFSRPPLRRYDSLPDYKRLTDYQTFPYKSTKRNKKDSWEYSGDVHTNFRDSFRDDYSREYPDHPPVLTRNWRSCYSLKTNGLSPEYNELQEKIHKLEGERDSLTLQVTVLTEQVDAQSEKIRDLETSLEEKKERLDATEEMLQHELLTRSSLETQKLDLLKELSNLKLQLAAAERERLELQSKNHAVQLDLSTLQQKLSDREQEVNYLRSKFNKVPDQDQEIEKLKRALESLMAANEEKDQKIEDLRSTISRYKRVQDMVMTAKVRKSDSITSNDDMDNIFFDNISDHNVNGIIEPVRASSKERNLRFQEDLRVADKPPPVPRHNSVSSQGAPTTPILDNRYPPIPARTLPGMPGVRKPPIGARSSSCEEIPNDLPPLPPLPPKAKYASAILFHQTPPANRRNMINQYASSPSVEHTIENPEVLPRKDPMETFRPRPKGHGLSFGKGLFKSLRSNKRCTSAPNLAQSEILEREREGSPRQPSPGVNSDSRYSPDIKKKPKGIKRLFGRLIRSSSQSLHPEPQEPDAGDFKRGGLRSTAGPRLGWSKELRGQDTLDIPFARWDPDKISAWLHDLGLTAYVTDCKRWVRNGDHLLQASAHDLEKELGVRHPLHRKKLQLTLQAIGSEENDIMGQLDYQWVTRWLDDIGLPLYKDQFNEARIDGRMLHYLTVEDLFFLKVTNVLHHTSLKRGIQVLRENGFNPNCLKRRPTPEEISVTLKNIPTEVVLWTNHRVMEWLRTVDLSEYAANLRGSGVHGALMILEPRFDAEVLATVLSIPSSKTLLRRHLNTHFTTLVGNEIIQKKREAQADASYVPISPSAKVKPIKKGFTLMRKHNKGEVHFDEYVCPMDTQSALLTAALAKSRTLPQRRDSDGSLHSTRSEVRETMLTDDKIFAEMTTSTV